MAKSPTKNITPALFEIYRAQTPGGLHGSIVNALHEQEINVPCFRCELINESIKELDRKVPGIQTLIANQRAILNIIKDPPQIAC